ncbi:Gfo/Idh/MocA family oxidoreductase [Chitinophaga sp. MM2321]|uniref:Gfo/Idh/MocA family protein n=1 Tax=Chitinophaga sp. MM2321 TaxID=3137178 RepID=UPI0032D591F9
MNTITWGIIGCGNVTEVKSGPAFKLASNSSVHAVMRRDAALAKDYAARHGIAAWYNDAYALLDDPEVNAIYIATPPASHEEYAMAAIDRGYPVYIEKPVGLDAAAANRIAAAVASKNGLASVAHYRRRLPAFICVKQLLEQKAIGEVVAVDLRFWKAAAKENAGWRLDPGLSGGGYFHDLAPHQLDIMLYYFGKPLQCNGLSAGSDPRVADIVSGQILFEDNILFNGSWNFISPENEITDECIISGSKGSIRFHFFTDFDQVTLKTADHTETFRFENPKHIQQHLIADVVSYFRGEGSNPCSVAEAATGLELMEQFLRH